MADQDYTIIITSVHNQYQADPNPCPATGQLDVEDSVTFDVRVPKCRICFKPKDVFGSHLRLSQGIHGPYTPAANHDVTFWIIDHDVKCKDVPIKATYSIKVG